MKKTLLALFVATMIMVSCNEANETNVNTTTTDSTQVSTDTTKVVMDSVKTDTTGVK